MPSLSLRPCRPYYTFFNMFKVRHHPFLYVHEDLANSYWFLLRSTSSYCVHSIFRGPSKNVVECEGGIANIYGEQKEKNVFKILEKLPYPLK